MSELIGGLLPEEWKSLGLVLTFLLIGAITAIRNIRKEPIELGAKPPPVDLNQYLLQDVRSLARRMEDLNDRVDDMHDENGRNIEALRRDVSLVYTDTQVIRDRQK